MLKTLALGAALALAAPAAFAAGEAEITDYAFAHEGPFGSYDTLQLQRGLQVYTEVEPFGIPAEVDGPDPRGRLMHGAARLARIEQTRAGPFVEMGADPVYVRRDRPQRRQPGNFRPTDRT